MTFAVHLPPSGTSGPDCVLRALQPNPLDFLGPLLPRGGDADQQCWGRGAQGSAGGRSLALAAVALPQHPAAPQVESTAGHPESPDWGEQVPKHLVSTATTISTSPTSQHHHHHLHRHHYYHHHTTLSSAREAWHVEVPIVHLLVQNGSQFNLKGFTARTSSISSSAHELWPRAKLLRGPPMKI